MLRTVDIKVMECGLVHGVVNVVMAVVTRFQDGCLDNV